MSRVRGPELQRRSTLVTQLLLKRISGLRIEIVTQEKAVRIVNFIVSEFFQSTFRPGRVCFHVHPCLLLPENVFSHTLRVTSYFRVPFLQGLATESRAAFEQ